MSQKKNFIVTSDKETADKLAFSGFQLVSQNHDVYIFLNQPPKNFKFEEFDQKNMAYTNILNV